MKPVVDRTHAQDDDGSHIKGLVINMFHCLWPSLLQHNFLFQFVTPLVKASKRGHEPLWFFDGDSYQQWRRRHTAEVGKLDWTVKFYKGNWKHQQYSNDDGTKETFVLYLLHLRDSEIIVRFFT